MARRELDPRLREIELRRERVRCGFVALSRLVVV
jgi:hypothetical protein